MHLYQALNQFLDDLIQEQINGIETMHQMLEFALKISLFGHMSEKWHQIENGCSKTGTVRPHTCGKYPCSPQQDLIQKY